MLDASLRPLIDPPLNAFGKRLADAGIDANTVTLAGFLLGIAAAVAIATGHPLAGLVLIIVSRLADGLDGAVARATKATDLGGYLDIVLDFLFYGAIPLAFIVADPAANALAGAALLASFYASGAAFLAFAIIAEKRKLSTTAQGEKSIYYAKGIVEGTETIGCFLIMCLWPQHFPAIAWIFAAICYVSAGWRIVDALTQLRT